MLAASAQRPKPVINPLAKETAPMTAISSHMYRSAASASPTASTASAKPKLMLLALSRTGAGKSPMLAAMAPSEKAKPWA